MALSDLELLSLVERAQEAKQGPIGPAGVGIRSIEQLDAETVVINLDDGRRKEIRLTQGLKVTQVKLASLDVMAPRVVLAAQARMVLLALAWQGPQEPPEPPLTPR